MKVYPIDFSASALRSGVGDQKTLTAARPLPQVLRFANICSPIFVRITVAVAHSMRHEQFGLEPFGFELKVERLTAERLMAEGSTKP